MNRVIKQEWLCRKQLITITDYRLQKKLCYKARALAPQSVVRNLDANSEIPFLYYTVRNQELDYFVLASI